VDARLFHVAGVRPELLTNVDLPVLARGITSAIRGIAKAGKVVVHGLTCIHITASGYSFVVRGDEWEKIAPYLTDGTLDPLAFPPSVIFPLDPTSFYDPSVIDVNDAAFYEKVLNLLGTLFSGRRFPLSNL
jgi:hypothetical protein